MNKLRFLALSFVTATFLLSCGNSEKQNGGSETVAPKMMRMAGGAMHDGPVFIPTDSANKMIQSYLTSIGGSGHDTDLRSLIFDADSLRAYLSNPAIKNIKVMFAHTLDFINAGGEGQNVGYSSNALTVVFGGYDEQGNYVLHPGNKVPDFAQPCPTTCVEGGTASSDLFPTH